MKQIGRGLAPSPSGVLHYLVGHHGCLHENPLAPDNRRCVAHAGNGRFPSDILPFAPLNGRIRPVHEPVAVRAAPMRPVRRSRSGGNQQTENGKASVIRFITRSFHDIGPEKPDFAPSTEDTLCDSGIELLFWLPGPQAPSRVSTPATAASSAQRRTPRKDSHRTGSQARAKDKAQRGQ